VALAHGDILLTAAAPAADAARSLFAEAARLSADRGARMLEVQALTRLATPGPGSPRTPSHDAARQRLREVLKGFTEGHDAAPLTAAAAVLSRET